MKLAKRFFLRKADKRLEGQLWSFWDKRCNIFYFSLSDFRLFARKTRREQHGASSCIGNGRIDLGIGDLADLYTDLLAMSVCRIHWKKNMICNHEEAKHIGFYQIQKKWNGDQCQSALISDFARNSSWIYSHTNDYCVFAVPAQSRQSCNLKLQFVIKLLIACFFIWNKSRVMKAIEPTFVFYEVCYNDWLEYRCSFRLCDVGIFVLNRLVCLLSHVVTQLTVVALLLGSFFRPSWSYFEIMIVK